MTGLVARPLTIAEIFDRAVTLVVQRRGPVLLLSALVVLPLVPLRALPSSSHWFASAVLLLGLTGFFVGALGSAALVNVLAGRAQGAREALRLARRDVWLAVRSYFVAGAALAIVTWGCAFPVQLALGTASGGSALGRLEGGALLGIPAAVVAAPVVLALSIAFPTTILERSRASEGIARAWSRVFHRGDLGRAWLLGAALGLVTNGIEYVLQAAVEHVAGATGAAWLSGVEACLVGVCTLAYGTALTTIAAIDYRVRTQGADLDAALDAAR